MLASPTPLLRRRLSDFIVSKISKLLDSYGKSVKTVQKVEEHPHCKGGRRGQIRSLTTPMCLGGGPSAWGLLQEWPFGLKLVKEIGTHPERSMLGTPALVCLQLQCPSRCTTKDQLVVTVIQYLA